MILPGQQGAPCTNSSLHAVTVLESLLCGISGSGDRLEIFLNLIVPSMILGL